MSKTFLVLAVLVLVLSGCGNKDQPGGAKVSTSAPDATVKVPLFGETPDAAPRDPAVAAGEKVFGKYCALCHGAEGHGYVADNAPSLVSSTFLETATDEFLVTAIRDGRPGTPMAAYHKMRGGPLEDADVQHIISFLRDRGPQPITLPQSTGKGDAKRGQAIYDASCKLCHGDASGAPAVAVKLWNPSFVASATDEFLRYAIEHGRPGTKMMPMGGAKLEAQQIDDLVALIRSWQVKVPEQPVAAPPKAPTPKDGPLVINPKGANPSFTLREDRFVPAADVAKALAAGQRMVILDARPASDWSVMHIPGALSSPYYEPELLDAIPPELKKDTWFLAYCACPHHASGEVVDALRKLGFEKTAVIDEGIAFWQQQGYPVKGIGANAGTVKP